MKALILILVLLFPFSHSSLAQTTHELQFNGDGLMTSAPPSLIERGDKLRVKVNTDQTFWEERINAAIERYLIAIENINNDKSYRLITDSPTAEADLASVKCSLCKEVNSVIGDYVKTENQDYFKQKLNVAGCNQDCGPRDSHTPSLTPLIDPEISLFLTFYDNNGNKLYNKQEEYKMTTPVGANPPTGAPSKNYTFFETEKPILIETSFYEVKYELRLKNSLYTVIQDRLKNLMHPFPTTLGDDLTSIQKELDEEFFIDYENLKNRVSEAKKFLSKNETDMTKINQEWLDKTNQILERVNKKVDNSINFLDSKTNRDWLIGWMWLTQGIPRINPFDFQSLPLLPSANPTVRKVTEREKAIVELFEKLISSQAFQMENVSEAFIDPETEGITSLDDIASIKARLVAEKNVKISQDDKNSDILLYSGLLKTYHQIWPVSFNPKERNYMLSHDASNNMVIMNNSYVKEITENDKLYVFLNNKKVDDKYTIEVIPTLIKKDLSQIADEISLSDDSDRADLIKEELSKKPTDLEKLKENLKTLIRDYNLLNETKVFLTSLSKGPTLPIQFVKDQTPYLKTENLIYNNQFKAPATAEYTIKSVKADSVENVYKGEFRINKLYNLRFKAGLVYSNLTKHDYTKTSTNTFTDTKEDYGLDGTFGIQIFPKKTDMRDINITKGKFPPCLYLGLSMRGIQENFYVGAGFEVFSGLSVMYMGHIGRTEQLVGEGALLTGTRNVWKWGNGVALTIDGSLFVSLFQFGNNKDLLGIQ